MICISVTPHSRRLARVDLLNASHQGDLIELCLDQLRKHPDVGEIIEGFEKPIIVSCRRPGEGGSWEGTEDDRRQLLRNAIIAEPAYIELEPDVAKTIPRFGNVRRIVSCSKMRTIKDIFAQARDCDADVIKLAWPTRNLDEMWPMLAAVSGDQKLPIVGMGMDRAGITFSLLAKKYGSPWIYAALEERMEVYPGQATVWELREAFALDEIDRETRWIGVAGWEEDDVDSIAALNDALKQMNAKLRCLPLRVGKTKNLLSMLETLKIRGIIVGMREIESLLPIIDHPHRMVEETGTADLLLKRDDGWHGFNTLRKAVVRALRSSGKEVTRRRVLLLGTGPRARAVLRVLDEAEAAVSVAAPGDKAAKKLAEAEGVSFVSWSAIYDTVSEFVVFADSEIPVGLKSSGLNPSLLREHTTLLDISAYPCESPLTEEGRVRGCHVIEPRDIRFSHLSTRFRAITGEDLPESVFESR